MTTKLSIALCTYNGQKYLPEQLESMLIQTRQPDELVVCDDQSSDATAKIIQDFANRCQFPVRWYRNETRLRSTLNFAKAIELCEGEYIALCDQDDVWHPQKLELLERTLDEHPKAGFVITDADVVDEKLQSLGYSLWESLRFTPREQRSFLNGNAFRLLLKRYRATGATMMFRASYRNLILPIPPSWIHDAWIAQLLSAVSDVALIHRQLIQYRQHNNQQIGQLKRNLYQQYLVARTLGKAEFQNQSENFQLAFDRLSSTTSYDVSNEDLQNLKRKISHARHRANMRDHKFRLPAILSEYQTGNYGRYSFGWKSVVQDLFL